MSDPLDDIHTRNAADVQRLRQETKQTSESLGSLVLHAEKVERMFADKCAEVERLRGLLSLWYDWPNGRKENHLRQLLDDTEAMLGMDDE